MRFAARLLAVAYYKEQVIFPLLNFEDFRSYG